MNETLKNLETRRSCRKFKPDMITDEELNSVLRAGTYAPTGMGKQSPIILAITNKEIRDALAEENRKIGDGQSHYNNPRISFNGKHWFISVGIERPEEKVELTSTVLESDLGIKVLAYVSDGTWYPNINKSAKVRNLQNDRSQYKT